MSMDQNWISHKYVDNRNICAVGNLNVRPAAKCIQTIKLNGAYLMSSTGVWYVWMSDLPKIQAEAFTSADHQKIANHDPQWKSIPPPTNDIPILPYSK